jgi:hypothetical protein
MKKTTWLRLREFVLVLIAASVFGVICALVYNSAAPQSFPH